MTSKERNQKELLGCNSFYALTTEYWNTEDNHNRLSMIETHPIRFVDRSFSSIRIITD